VGFSRTLITLLLLARGDVGELRPERLLELLHLLDALHRGRQPGLEDRLGVHRVEATPQAVLDLAHDALLHRQSNADKGVGEGEDDLDQKTPLPVSPLLS